MQQLQIVFERYLDERKQVRSIKSIVNDALKNNKKYQEICEEASALNAQKRKIVLKTYDEFAKEVSEIDTLEAGAKSDEQLMSDIVLSNISKGQPAGTVTDKYGVEWEPTLKVKFKKV